MAWWDAVIGGLTGPIATYFTEKSKQKHELAMQDKALDALKYQKQVEMINKGLDIDSQWELEEIKNSGWKDEYVLVLLSIPLIMVFIPGLAPYAMAGFSVLSQTPEWYRWLVMMIFAAVYGIRLWRRV